MFLMRRQIPNRKFLFFILTAFFVFSPDGRADESLRVEGIIEDPSNQAESLAVINGHTVKPGDRVGSYRVETIQSISVKLLHQGTKQETVLYLKDKEFSAAEKTASKSGNVSPPKTLAEEAQSYFRNPGKAMDRAWELKALRDLAVINNAAVKYYEKNGFFPVRMRQLTLDGFLPADYEKGTVHKYQFYFKNTPMKPDDFQLHADPIEKENGLRSFFVGADAVIRESEGRPAQANSPAHQYPGKKD